MIHCSILMTLVHSGPQGDGSGYRDRHNIQAFVANSSEIRSSSGSVRLIFDMVILTDLQPKRSELFSSVDTLLLGLVSLRCAWVSVGVNVSVLNQPIKENLARFLNMTLLTASFLLVNTLLCPKEDLTQSSFHCESTSATGLSR